MKELLSNVGSGGGAPAVGAPAAGGGGGAPAAEAPAEEKKEEEKEESDDDMVRGYSVCLYTCQVLKYAYVISHVISYGISVGLWSLRLIYNCSQLHRLSLHFPSRCISLCITRK